MDNVIKFPQRTTVPDSEILYHAQAQAQYVPDQGLRITQDWHVTMPNSNS